MKIKKSKTLIHGKNGRIEQDKENLIKLNNELQETLSILWNAQKTLQEDRTLWKENLDSSISASNMICLKHVPKFDEYNKSIMELIEFSTKMRNSSKYSIAWECRQFTRQKFVMSWISNEQKEHFDKPVKELISLIGFASRHEERYIRQAMKGFTEGKNIIPLLEELCAFVAGNTTFIEEGAKHLNDDERLSLENLKKLSNIAQLKLQLIDEKLEEVSQHIKTIQRILEQSKNSIEKVNILVGIDELESRFGNRIPETSKVLSQYNTDEMKNKMLEARKLSHTVNAYREIR